RRTLAQFLDRHARVAVDDREVRAVGRRETIEQRLVGPGTAGLPPFLHIERCGMAGTHRYCAPYTGARGGACASSLRTALPISNGSQRACLSSSGPCCQPSAIERRPPSISN